MQITLVRLSGAFLQALTINGANAPRKVGTLSNETHNRMRPRDAPPSVKPYTLELFLPLHLKSDRILKFKTQGEALEFASKTLEAVRRDFNAAWELPPEKPQTLRAAAEYTSTLADPTPLDRLAQALADADAAGQELKAALTKEEPL